MGRRHALSWHPAPEILRSIGFAIPVTVSKSLNSVSRNSALQKSLNSVSRIPVTAVVLAPRSRNSALVGPSPKAVNSALSGSGWGGRASATNCACLKIRQVTKKWAKRGFGWGDGVRAPQSAKS